MSRLNPTFKSILIYLFSILISGIILALGIDAINQKINEDITVDTTNSLNIEDVN